MIERPTYGRAAPIAFFTVYVLPGTVAIASDSWARPADPLQRAYAMASMGLGGLAVLFILLVLVVPVVLRAAGKADFACRWRCAAFHGGIPAALFTTAQTLTSLPIGPIAARVALGMSAAVAVFVALLWAKRRWFDGPCGQLRGWPRW